MKILIILSALILFFGIAACKKTKNETDCKYDAIPNSMFLKITKNGIVLNDTVLANCKLSYIDGAIKKYITDFSKNNLASQYQGMGLISTRLVGILSADNSIKTFYLEYPQAWSIDTLTIDYLKPTPSTNCLYIQNSVKQNGVPAEIDSSLHFNSPVFIIAKP
jgi:hypothetical protein